MYVFFTLLLCSLPSVVLIFGFIPSRFSSILKKVGLISYLLTIVITASAHYHFLTTYGFPLLPSFRDNTVALFVIGLFAAIFLLCMLITHFLYRHAPKEVYNPRAIWIFFVAILVHLSLIIVDFHSLGKKWEYAHIYSRAQIVFAVNDEKANEDINVKLLYSAPEPCYRNCSHRDYLNLFMAKNQTDHDVEVKVTLYAYDKDKELLLQTDSLPMTIPPGKIRQIATNKTNLKTSIWDQWTFRTKVGVAYYRYEYKLN